MEALEQVNVLAKQVHSYVVIRLRTGGLISLRGSESFGDISLPVRCGEKCGDSMHAEAHAGTSCHYQILR